MSLHRVMVLAINEVLPIPSRLPTTAMLAAAIAAIGLLVGYRQRHRARRNEAKLADHSFADQPWLYDQAIIECVGRVEHVFPDTFSERGKRLLVHFLRGITHNNDPTNRYSHQRFLISSPALQAAERILVHHNATYGRITVRRGDWVSITGTYVHKPASKDANSRTKHFQYGLVHKTHQPHGKIRPLAKPPTLSDCVVRILTSATSRRG